MSKPTTFVCTRCTFTVPYAALGTQHRNHCPRCLWSRHVDHHCGDRQSPCRGDMEPIAIEVRSRGSAGREGEWAIVHRCTGCNLLRTNRVAGDDHELMLLALALRPIASPAFPLDDVRPPSLRSDSPNPR